ncbi:MAG: DUF502 domain-containing protein [Hyphomicrobium sp.]|nr:DUF502 domain-containing protein [Hyphomicrobium sp.]
MKRIASIFLAGLLAILPVAVTIAIAIWMVDVVATYAGPGSTFGSLLTSLGLSINRGSATPYVVGLLFAVAIVYAVGLLVESQIGQWLVEAIEGFLMRIPIVSQIYGLSKTFTSIVDTQKGENLKGMTPVWCFFGGEPGAAVLALQASAKPVSLGGQPYVGVLVPSAPVPFGGALIYVPATWVRPAEGGVEQLMGVYVSMGVTPPRPDGK